MNWLDRLYQKSELYFALAWIVVYCVGGSVANPLSGVIGIDSSAHTVFHLALTAVMLGWLKKNGLWAHYGLCRSRVSAKQALYYIPLILFVSHNLWFGVGIDLPLADMVCYLVSMLCVGLLEEVIFRGFLFRAMAKDNVRAAIIVSSVTFGIGHIINLFNGSGMELVSNLCQVIGAIACGFLFVILYYRGGSLIPCILAHSVNNMLSAFANEGALTAERKLLLSAANIVIAAVYTLVLNRTLPQKEDPGCAVTEFSCQREGLSVRGTEYRPEGNDLPAAIVCHGFMAWQDTVRQYCRSLAEQGYCTYCFDFCGGSVMKKGKSDGKTTEMSVLTEVQDLEAVIRYVQSLPYTSNDLLLMGCSQGGFVSALTAAKHPDLVSKLVLFYPALCIPDDARAGKMMLARFDPANIPQIIRCGPMKLGKLYAADVITMDPVREIRSYPGPVLIVHGRKDKIVELEYSRQAQQAYPNAELRIIEKGGHGFGRKHDAIAIEYLKVFASKETEG